MLLFKRSVLFKRVVILILVVIALSISGAVYFVYQRSMNMDEQHIQVISLSGEVNHEILEARMLVNHLVDEPNDYLKQQLIAHLDSIREGFEKLNIIFTEEFKKIQNNDLEDFVAEYKVISTNYNILEAFLKEDKSCSEESVEELVILYGEFSNSYRQFGQFLHRYLYDNTIHYKRDIFRLLIVIFVLVLISGYSIVYLINQLIITDRNHIQKTIEVESRERQRIAADLHDGLGAYLSSMIMYIEVMGKEYETDPNLVKKTEYLNQLSRSALQSVEEVINNLSPKMLSRMGLVRTLDSTIKRINSLDKTQFSLDASLMQVKLELSMKIMLYRICMELINNALKHSSAKDARFTLYSMKNKIHLNYEDNGVGFQSDDHMFENSKTGLYNLAKRVEAMGGNHTVISEPDKGVRIKIVLNIN